MTAETSKKLRLTHATAGFVIPYFSLAGVPLKHFRYRHQEDTRTGWTRVTSKKAQRYAQPKGSPTEVYFPPLLPWKDVAADAALPVVITEGELKSACACKFGYATIGLGGVTGFAKPDTRMKELLPVFDEFVWDDRCVFICFDSDGATNHNIVRAEGKLAEALVTRGAVVMICRIPQGETDPETGEVAKMGIDDYMLRWGAEMFQVGVLDKAIPWSTSAALHAVNEEVVYVKNPGVIWDHGQKRRMSPNDFVAHQYADRSHTELTINTKGEEVHKVVQTAEKWIKWPHRATATHLDFVPSDGRVTEDGALNTWQGWGLPEGPSAGDYSEWVRLLDHLFGDDDSARRYFEQWCAWPLQNPGGKMSVAAAVWGSVHGSGKTLVGNTLMRIYGPNHSAELKDNDLEDARFSWAEDKQFILADDITARGDRKFMRRLMTMVTQRTIRLDPKYIAAYSVKDRINYYYTSNDPDALYMDDGDRRFFIHEVLSGKFKSHMDYVQWMESASGIAALWDYLLQLDLTDFDPHAPPPDTLGKRDMIEVGKSELGAWVYEFVQNTEHVLRKFKMKGDMFSAKQLHMMFDPNGDKRTTVNALARELKRVGFKAPARGYKLKLTDGQQVSVYTVRNREAWNAAGCWGPACKHYEENNPTLVVTPNKKF